MFAGTAYVSIGDLLRKLGEALGNERVPLPPRYSPGSPTESAAFQIIHHDCDVELTSHRLAMRQVLALPIFRLSRMGHSVPSLACRGSPGPHLCSMGAAGVGLERLSQHECELGRCGALASSPSVWCVVQWVERSKA